MLNKKWKVVLSLFTALTVMWTMSFAADEEVTNSETNTDTNTEITSEAVENVTSDATSEDLSVTSEESTTGEENQGETVDNSAQQTPQTKDGDVYEVGDNIELTEAINGNVFIKANTLTVKGQIGGDLFVLADKINLDGAQIYGNVFAIANEITINGLIYDLYGLCNTLSVPYNGTVYRDLKVACKNATINGVVGGSVKITVSENLTLENDCIIYKDLNYTSPNEIEIKEGAVQGSVNHSAMTEMVKVGENPAPFSIWNVVFPLMLALFIWVIISFLAPKFTEKVYSAGKNRPIASLLFGFLGIILIPVCMVLLFLSIVGVPIALALMLLYFIMIVASLPIAVISIANMLGSKVEILGKVKNLLAVILVSVLVSLLSIVPIASAIVTPILCIYGFGIIILSVLNKVSKNKKVEAKNETK